MATSTPSGDHETSVGEQGTTRRTILKMAGLAGAGGLMASWLSGCATGAGSVGGRGGEDGPIGGAGTARGGRGRRVLRAAHLTDTHIQPEKGATEGVAAALRHMQAQADKPELVLFGGDLIMDGFEQDKARTELQWALWKRVIRDECGLPAVYALGNHDIWGWNKGKSKTTGGEPGWGKQWACDELGLDSPYGAMDFGGCRLITLDSVQVDPRNEKGYIGQLDEGQFDWLLNMLKSTPAAMPVVVVSHIPILSATALIYGDPKVRTDDHAISIGRMHSDSRRVVALLRQHPNVRVCLSGHMHMLDMVEVPGLMGAEKAASPTANQTMGWPSQTSLKFMCNGAVSGSWWNGPNQGVDAGYSLIDLYEDGSVERTYVSYGWVARG